VNGYWVTAFAQIDVTNLPLVQLCIALFGGLYAGLNVPMSALQQFDQGQPWSTVSRSPIEGGHCVNLGGFGSGYVDCHLGR
jgi:hypothetical protein